MYLKLKIMKTTGILICTIGLTTNSMMLAFGCVCLALVLIFNDKKR
jgi:hypothetical protein